MTQMTAQNEWNHITGSKWLIVKRIGIGLCLLNHAVAKWGFWCSVICLSIGQIACL